MKKLKNKFILWVIWVIALIIFSQVFIAYSHRNIDTNSYLTLVKWNGTLNEDYLKQKSKYKLSSGDKIRIIWEASLAVIEWWDGSLTRLGGDTKISIDKNKISRDYTNINISFELIAGKTWSNVVSFIGKDSSFTQSFIGMEAGVRWTVFDVDLTKDFIHVSDHQVELKDNNGKIITVGERASLQLSNLTFLDIQEFIENFQNNAWIQINTDFDTAYFESLKKNLSEELESKTPFLFIMNLFSPKYKIIHELNTAENYENIERLLIKLPEKKRKSVYNAVLSKYQSINFVSVNDYEFYKRKVFYKKALISLAENKQDREQFIRSTAYDLQDMIRTRSSLGMKEVLSLLSENKDILKNIDVSFLKEDLQYIPEGLRKEFKTSFEDIQNIFEFDINLKNLPNLENIWNTAKNLLKNADKWAQDFLNKSAKNILDRFWK